MSTDSLKITAGFALLVIVSLIIIQGCGDLTGNISTNQAPIVEFVNVPIDAYGADTTYHYGMPFSVASMNEDITILNMQGALMVEGSERVYALSVDEIPDTTYFERDQDYTMDYMVIAGSDTIAVLQALDTGGMVAGNTYYIDFAFTISNYYVVSYAPTVYWKGEDSDGFVEYYRYADVSDPEFIQNFREDPGYYYEHYNELTWVDTTTMSARIFLLTEAGDTTEHVVFLKAVDDLNKQSEGLVYKTFYRTNNPPNNPEIKRLEAAETEYALNVDLVDTMFCLPTLTPNWDGISFNWRATDPDDKELYQIPLEFTYYLIKTPGDTLWDQSSSDWSDVAQIQLFGLETGSYIFSVWVRDDGLTLSEEPATISFNVVKPTFEHHILLIDETVNTGGFVDIQTGNPDIVEEFYTNILSEIEGTLENDNYVMDGVDVRLKDNSNPYAGGLTDCPIPFSLIGQYKLVMIFADDHAQAPATYITNRNQILSDYLDTGGQVWFTGRRVLSGEFSAANSDPGEADPVTGFLLNYMQITTGFASNRQAPGQAIECIGAIPVITNSMTESYEELYVDSAKVGMLNDPQYSDSTKLMEVDWYTKSDDAQTLYTFNSSTADTDRTSPYVYNENPNDSAGSVGVQPGATQEQCIIIPVKDGILDVYYVENVTKGVVGDVMQWNATQIWVSYQGEPWTQSDELLINYKYDPISNAHLKPVAVRYENQPRVQTTLEINGFSVTVSTATLGYRTALFGIPLFFMENNNGEVTDLVRNMLNWFFYPEIHWEI